MIASNMPAGYKRDKFGFFSMPNFNEKTWLEMKQKENSKIINIPDVHKQCKFVAADIDQGNRDPFHRSNLKLIVDESLFLQTL